jgi:hypothetical protein
MTENIAKLERGYYRFPQYTSLVILIDKHGKEMPVLSEEAVRLLKTAKSNAHVEGWSIISWHVKVALMQQDLLRVILRARKTELPSEWKGEQEETYPEHCKRMEPFAWEAIEFLDYWVYDVYPFRDNRPDD